MTQSCNRPPATPRAAARRRDALSALLEPELFQALSDPTRLALLACLSRCSRECSVSEIAGCCAVDLSVVSRHLAALERAGAVASRREGRTVFYAVRYAELVRRLRQIADALESCRAAGDACSC